jgi:hypothetical protein
MAVNQLSESIVIAADPETVYDVVSDVTRTGEWSPVCRECWWEDGAGPVAGAWFGGRQEVPDRTWETRSLVLEADRGRAFTWQVGGRFVIWGYRLEAVDGGTELTETWQINDATETMFAEKYAERADQVLDQRRQEATAGIPATLARLKEIIESENPANGG